MKQELRILQCMDDVNLFNTIAQRPLHEASAFSRQIKQVQEELGELRDKGVLLADPVETLDGVVDVLFTAVELMFIAQIFGYDVVGAWEEVCSNNLTKFPLDYEQCVKSKEMYLAQGVEVDIRKFEPANCYVLIKRDDGKIMKPLGYQKVDLKKYLPGAKQDD